MSEWAAGTTHKPGRLGVFEAAGGGVVLRQYRSIYVLMYIAPYISIRWGPLTHSGCEGVEGAGLSG